MKKTAILIALYTALSFDVSAQLEFEFQVNWESDLNTFNLDEQSYIRPTFTGAFHHESSDFYPVYLNKIIIPKGQAVANVLVEVVQSEIVYSHHSKFLSRIKSESLSSFKWETKTERGQQVVLFEYLPIAGTVTGVTEVTRFIIRVQTQQAPAKAKSLTFTVNSKMANGDWYKIGVVSDGLYRIDRNYLNAIGINVQSLNPQSLNIYGNGFGQLPINNSIPRPDDLLANNIYVEGESDGVFDQGDYILFYAKGPHQWSYDATSQLFNHSRHSFCDTSYYFIGINTGDAPKRISGLPSASENPNYDVTSFNDYTFHETERENLIKSGREWYGEKFDVQTLYTFSGSQYTFPNPEPGSEAVVRANVISRRTTGGVSTAVLSVNGVAQSTNINSVGTGVTSPYANGATINVTLQNPPASLTINLEYLKNNVPSAVGWINWLNVNIRRKLQMSGNQMIFRDANSVAPDRVSRYTITNANSVTEVWDVTSPTDARTVQLTRNGDQASYILNTPTLKEFVAFSGSTFPAPVSFGQVPNQNLHSLGQDGVIDMIIVSPGQFMSRAEDLANLHRNYAPDPLNVVVVRLNEIYNEFSSGMRDITSIKWLMKMLYDRANGNTEAMPRYLLLFGDGSYDNRNSTPGNTNFIPTYQSPISLLPATSYVSDDYFGFLDDNEGESIVDVMDIGIGRLVVKNNQEATSVVNKIKRYMTVTEQDFSPDCTVCNTTSSNIGSWRNIISLVADDGDGNDHMVKSNSISNQINTYTRNYNLERIFIDAFPQVATPGGSRYPTVNEAINRRVKSGAFIINYIGHGGELGWAQERILDIPTILSWDNTFAMPLFMTATCEFTRFDDPLRTSAGEHVLLNGNGGGVALLTTTRLVYSGPNFTLNQRFYDALFNRPPDEIVTRLGDVSKDCKNASLTSGSSNHRNFSLIGDPALPLAIPKHQVIITAITDTLDQPVDTMKALAVVRVKGAILRNNGSAFNDFNGRLVATVFDREKSTTTLANDGGNPMVFKTQEDIIYRGNAEVINGQYTFEFVLPRDISFAVDTTARISLYAYNENEDAAGYTNNLKIGDRDPNAVDNGQGPQVQVFMNDENFVNGGFTSDTPILLSKVFDESGINTVGSGIGHDITATLDGDTRKVIVLNDYYESELNTYKSGKIIYKLDKLEPGNHNLKLKVWNVHNNSSEETLEFVVASSEEFAIERVLNYPNPFTSRTDFYFEHNQSCEFLNVQIEVFTVSGKLVKSIVTVSNTDGFRNEPITWNGRDDFGDKLATGVYVYKITVRNPAGEKVSKFEKLVILN
jgi:hypothetical protein